MKKLRCFMKYAVLVTISFFSVFPFVWMLISITNTSSDISSGKMSIGGALSDNLASLLSDGAIVNAFMNTAKIAIVGTILSLLVTSLAAYGFEMFTSKYKEKIYGWFLLSMMIPFAALMIPLYKMMIALLNGFMNVTGGGDVMYGNMIHLAVILPGIVNVFMILFFRQSFKAFPRELIEAARIDGLGEFAIFFKIVLPAMKATYAAASIYIFTGFWNAYLWPVILIKNNAHRTLTLLISSYSSSYTPDFGLIMIAIVIATIPMIVLFFALQKQFVQGMLGSVK